MRLYNEHEVFVSPSLYEGFGLPAAEAMACGTPVVATTAGAFPETIADGETGMLVPPADARALADAIAALLANPGQPRGDGCGGRAADAGDVLVAGLRGEDGSRCTRMCWARGCGRSDVERRTPDGRPLTPQWHH